MKEVKIYSCEYNSKPNEDDIKEAINIATKNNCIVRLEYHIKWSGTYSIDVNADDDVSVLLERIPKLFGM